MFSPLSMAGIPVYVCHMLHISDFSRLESNMYHLKNNLCALLEFCEIYTGLLSLCDRALISSSGILCVTYLALNSVDESIQKALTISHHFHPTSRRYL